MTNCVFTIFLLLISCSITKRITEQAEIQIALTAEDKSEVESKRALLQRMLITRDASEVKSNFGDGIVVSRYEEPMASIILDAAVEQAPSETEIEVIKIIKTDGSIKVLIRLHFVDNTDELKEDTTSTFFRLNSSFQFVELQLFEASANMK